METIIKIPKTRNMSDYFSRDNIEYQIHYWFIKQFQNIEDNTARQELSFIFLNLNIAEYEEIRGFSDINIIKYESGRILIQYDAEGVLFHETFL